MEVLGTVSPMVDVPILDGTDAIDEVVRQHVFIEAWMAGAEVAESGWADFDRSLAEDFVMVPPSGVARTKAELLASFGAARGVMAGVSVEVRDAVFVHNGPDVAIVRYEEWQTHPSMANQRISTAVFTPDGSAPLGWSWRALHETALPDLSVPAHRTGE